MFAATAFAQVANGDYRTRVTGNWNAPATWQIRTAGAWATATTTPGAGDNVFLQAGHVITLTQNESCKDFHISVNTSSTRLAMGAFSLSVNGKLRAMTDVTASTGTTDGNIPGTSTGTLGSSNAWITSNSGAGFIIAGGTRTLTLATEWGAGNAGVTATNGFDFTFNLTTGSTATNGASIKARNITLAAGIVDMGTNRLAPDQGTGSSGALTIAAGATLITAATGNAGSSVAARSANATSGQFGTFTNNGTINLSGAAPEIQAATIVMNGTVNYTGAAQTLLNKTVPSAANVNSYTNLTLSGSGIKTPSVATTVTGTLSLQGTATVAASPAFSYGATATLEYAGTAAQATGDEFPAAAGPLNVTINNAAGVTLSAPRTMSGNLTLTNGLLTTTTLNLLTLTGTATTSGVSNASYVSGPLQKAGTSAFTFPIGKGGKYRPASIGASGNAGDSYTAEYFNAAYSNLTVNSSNATPLNHVSSVEYWDITRNTGTNTPDVTLSFDAASATSPGTLTTLAVAHYNGATWDNLGQTGNTGATGSNGTITASTASLSSFSPFTLGTVDPAQPLPLQLINFTGASRSNGVLLQWTTGCENGMMPFEIEKSTGSGFGRIGTVTAYNNGCSARGDYQFTDAEAGTGTQLYRLKLTEASGKVTYSNTLRFNGNTTVATDLSLSPNPATDYLQVSGLEAGTPYTVSDVSGRVIVKAVAVGVSATVPVQSLQSGLYFFQAAGSKAVKFVKQ